MECVVDGVRVPVDVGLVVLGEGRGLLVVGHLWLELAVLLTNCHNFHLKIGKMTE